MTTKKQSWRQWVRAVERDVAHGDPPYSGTRLFPRCLAALTGTDGRVLDAFVACLELYAYDRDTSTLLAARWILSRMQPSTLWIAKELIAFVLEWDDREKLWPRVVPSPQLAEAR